MTPDFESLLCQLRNMATSDNRDSIRVLEYRIHKCSSYSSTYVPENILTDEPVDQGSRWSSDNDNQLQFLVLKLQRPAIVKTITFGKFEKTHVCNIKKFKVTGGMKSENMMTLLESGLKNDSVPETFEMKHVIGREGNYFPVRYISILPLQSWGPSFNFSIWHVRLEGIDDPKIVRASIDWVDAYLQKEVVRLCIKHFRHLELNEVVETLQRVTGVALEDHRMLTLYDILVNKGDYSQVESFIENAIAAGMCDEYIGAQSYRAVWKKMSCEGPKPGMRGGHQMVWDPVAESVYLFGGWDGNQDLADLWAYNTNTEKWTLICEDTEAAGGPSPRSCHKMCIDPERRQLFTLGRYLDIQCRDPENLKSDFYMYDIEANKWTLISEDTGAVGGPGLIFDHQMTMDLEFRTIYVIGGRVLIPFPDDHEEQGVIVNSYEPIFSGLYSYHVSTGTWKTLACDVARPSPQNVPVIRSRVGHSMLFHPDSRKLYIFGGQRNKDYLNDFFTYEVDTHQRENISLMNFGNKDASHVPAAGYTQRATIDPALGEIYVLSGLSKDRDKRDTNVQNSFWVYNIQSNRWSCIYRNENMGEKYWSKMQHIEPCPRFAHQLVYDYVKKVHYVFGGNPGRFCLPKLRLDDFWQLRLCQPSREQILRRCKFMIRKNRFKELARGNSVEALEYLQTEVSEIIDHTDEEQTKEFQLLASVLFREQEAAKSMEVSSEASSTSTSQTTAASRILHLRRTELYDKLAEFFPESLTQPRDNLIDLLPL